MQLATQHPYYFMAALILPCKILRYIYTCNTFTTDQREDPVHKCDLILENRPNCHIRYFNIETTAVFLCQIVATLQISSTTGTIFQRVLYNYFCQLASQHCWILSNYLTTTVISQVVCIREWMEWVVGKDEQLEGVMPAVRTFWISYESKKCQP